MAGRKIGRNDGCPCGSGRKYKKCCLLLTDKDVRVGDTLEAIRRAPSHEKCLAPEPRHNKCSTRRSYPSAQFRGLHSGAGNVEAARASFCACSF